MNLPDVGRLREKAPLWTTHAIRHEFGHALALMHEHQRALCDPWFDYDKISKVTGWTRGIRQERRSASSPIRRSST